MATRNINKKKSVTKKVTSKKRSLASKKVKPKVSKRVTKKVASKKPTSRTKSTKKTATKASSNKKSAAKKTTKKTSSKKATVGKKNITKKTTSRSSPTVSKKIIQRAPPRNSINLEQETINKLITEIKSLETNNYQLAQQLDKAQTKREIIAELKSYLYDLKHENKESNNNAYSPVQRTFDDTNKELVQVQERANNKDKLISKLKTLIAKKNLQPASQPMYEENEEENKETLPSIENIKHSYPGSVDAKWEEDVEVLVEESTPEQKKEKKELDVPAPETKEEPVKEIPKVSAEEVVEKKMAEIEEVSDKKKEEYQATKKRGVVSPEEAEYYSHKLKDMEFEVNKVFIGQHEAVKGVLLSVLCSAHSLLEGVPGLAKTLLIETLGLVIDGTTFKRIQFLPDLLPSDIIGGQVFNPKTAEYTIYKGPIFANFVLADEINRAPPKTHAAIMEAMQEKKINIESETFILDKPFFVLATQNPLENKGTYELPEAVLDRFMFKLVLDYPLRKYELSIITENATTKNLKSNVRAVMTKQEILDVQQVVKKVFISDKIREYIMDLVEATRGINKNIEGMKFVKYGAGVRASIYLCLAAQANAIYEGRNYVLPDDVDAIAPAILRHRVVVNYRGKAHNITPEKIVEEILSKVKAL